MVEEMDSFFDIITEFVEQEFIDDGSWQAYMDSFFDVFVEAKSARLHNIVDHKENRALRTEAGAIKNVIPTNLKDRITKKLEATPSEEQEDFLEGVIEKITDKEEKLNANENIDDELKQTLLDVLTEVLDMAYDALDELLLDDNYDPDTESLDVE